MIKKNSNKTHHFREGMSKYVILHHNPKIIKRIGEYLDNVEEVDNKNYFMIKGLYENKEITLIATGMGACNTGIITDQVISQGAEYIFKFGTFGALQDDIEIGDMYMPVSAVRAEGLTDAYAPRYYPATADMYLYLKTLAKAKELDINVKPEGIIHSVNIYSPYYQKTYSPNKYSP